VRPLMERHGDALTLYVNGYVRDIDSAEDLMIEEFSRMREAAGWRLSPAFDVNPTPGDNPKYLRSAIDFENDEALPEAALSACEWYRLDRSQVVGEARKMAQVLKGWRKAASANGISKASIEYMASCFDSAVACTRPG